MFIKFILTQQLAKLSDFVRESGDILHADKGVAYIGDLLCICKSLTLLLYFMS